jgi:hypothetical protein
MVGIHMSKDGGLKTRYKIFRTTDGSFVTELPSKFIAPILSETGGGHKIILGIIDTRSRKYMPWSIAALMHIASPYKI